MSKRIKDLLPEFSFGLFSECPDHATIAWGARAISSHETGFYLISDRQNMVGVEPLGPHFSALLNNGPLKEAQKKAKRHHDGRWDLLEELLGEARTEESKSRFIKILREEISRIVSCCSGDLGRAVDFVYRRQGEGGLTPEGLRVVMHDGSSDFHKSLFADRISNDLASMREFLEDSDTSSSSKYDSDEEIPPPPDRCFGCNRKLVEGSRLRCDWSYDAECYICDHCGEMNYPECDDLDDYPHPKICGLTSAKAILANVMLLEPMLPDKEKLFTLFDDGLVKILGNTNASHGYVYLVAFPRHDKDLEGAVWSGKNQPPAPGDIFDVKGVGKYVCFGHIVVDGYLHINAMQVDATREKFENRIADGKSILVDVAGAEICDREVSTPDSRNRKR